MSLTCGAPPHAFLLQDNPRLTEYNVDSRVEDFVNVIMDQATVTRGDDIMILMGTDFMWANAHVWYKSLGQAHPLREQGALTVCAS